MLVVVVVVVWLAVDAKTSAHKIMIVVLVVVVVDVAVGVVNLGIVADTSARTVVVIDDFLLHTVADQVVSSLSIHDVSSSCRWLTAGPFRSVRSASTATTSAGRLRGCGASSRRTANKQTHKQTNKHPNKQTNKQANKQTPKQTNKQTNKQTKLS
jgi:hypothetical protein